MIFLGWVMDGNNGGTQQTVVAIAVRGGLNGEFQRIGHLQRCDGRRRRCPMQEIDDVRARGDLFIEGHGAGLGDGTPVHSVRPVKP
jgi:hypothetical protein